LNRTFLPMQKNFSVFLRISLAALLGLAACTHALAGKVDPATATAMLLIDLQNELILGEQLSPAMAACVDDEAAGRWVLPSKPGSEISDRAQQRKQRAREHCSAALTGVQGSDIPRNTSEAMHKVFAEHLQARLALEETKKHARTGHTSSRDDDGFERCLQPNAALVADDATRAQWLALFARYSTQR